MEEGKENGKDGGVVAEMRGLRKDDEVGLQRGSKKIRMFERKHK